MSRPDPLVQHIQALAARYADVPPQRLAERVAVATLHWIAVNVDVGGDAPPTVNRVRLAGGLRRTAARITQRIEEES